MLPVAIPAMPITDLRTRQPEVLESINRSPILLTKMGHSAGVLVHPEMWNALVEELEQYRRQRKDRHDQIRKEMDAGHFVTHEQLLTALESVKQQRVPGLHAGMAWVSDDFDEPLPDEFWLGDK